MCFERVENDKRSVLKIWKPFGYEYGAKKHIPPALSEPISTLFDPRV